MKFTRLAKCWNPGFALFRGGFVEESISSHKEAIRLDPLDLDAYRNLAIILNATEGYREAAAISILGLKNGPNHSGLLNTHGFALWKLGDTARASAEFKKAISAAPDFDRPYLNLARMLADTARPDDAMAVLGALLQRMPGHPQALEQIEKLRSGNP